MAGVIQMKPSSGNSEAMVILVDGMCIRCDGKHYDTPCPVKDAEWYLSDRCREAMHYSPVFIVHYIRLDRANKVLEGKMRANTKTDTGKVSGPEATQAR